MPIRSVTLRILGDSKDALAKMKLVNAEADKLEKRKVNVKVGMDIDNNDIVAVKAKIAAISKLQASISVKIDMKGLMADFATIKGQLAALRQMARDLNITPNVDIAQIAHANASLVAMNLAAQKAIGGIRGVATETKKADTVMGTIFRNRGGGFGLFNTIFGGKFVLFGGLATIGTLHLLVDVIAEVLAVWIPATVAAVAFGVAASDAAKLVFTHMQNLHTVMDATGHAIPPMTGAMEKLHQAVKPAVFQIFGDALTIMSDKTGEFSKLAMGAASVVQHLAARITIAITSSHGLSDFMRNAVPDLAKLTDGFASLFGILGNILHVMPGYAQVLLNFGDAFLHLAEWVSRVGEPLIKLGLYVHGFFVWAGLGATIAYAFGRALIFLGDTAIGRVVVAFFALLADFVTLTITSGVATAALYVFQAALDSISANPLVWIGAAVAGLAALAFWFFKSKDSSAVWAKDLQNNISSSSTILEGFNRTEQALSIASARLAVEQLKLAHTQEFMTVTNLHTGMQTRVLTGAYAEQSAKVAQTRAAYEQFNQEVAFNQGRMHGLEKVYGSATTTLGLLTAAGITQSDWQKKGAEGWLMITTMVNSTIRGYKAMGQQGGTLNNDLNVMDRNITDQYTAMQKLNQAWDQFITDVTGTQQNFDTVALGFKTLASNATTSSVSLGRARTTSVSLGNAMDGLTKKDLSLNQAFTTQVSQLNTLFDSWRTAGISSNQFTAGVKAGIDPLIKYARGSGEATAQLIGLAQEAGYKGPNSLKELTKWLGNAHNATQTLKKVSDQATIQEALLTGSMDAQAKAISNTLLGQLDQAILKYSKVTQDVQAYGKAIAEQGRQSDAARGARDRLISDLITTEQKAGLGKVAIAEMIHVITKIPLSRAINIVEHGTGKFSINGIFGTNPTQSSGNPLLSGKKAAGGIITGGTPGRDSVLGMLMPGEVVVPTGMVNAGAVDHLRGMLPGFANGGQAWPWGSTGMQPGAIGGAAVGYNNRFLAQMTTAMENGMTRAMKNAQASAAQTFGGGLGRSSLRQIENWWIGAGGPGGGTAHVAAAITGAESGFNVGAVQKGQPYATTGWGLWQITPGNSEPQFGINQQLLNGPANAGAAVAKYRAAGGFSPWTTFMDGAYLQFMSQGGVALPGWAWVGERGPELVNMVGGERVLDSPTSMKVTRGYASGTEGSRGASLINIFGNDQSNRSWREDVRKYLRYINDYYNGRAKNWRDDMLIRQTKAMERAQDRLGALNTRISDYNKFRSAAFQSIGSYGDLSNLTLGPTAGTGDNVALSGGAGLKSQLDQKLATMKQFAAALKKLSHMKIPASFLRQLVAMGPDQGLQYANELISAGPAFIKAFSKEEAQLTAYETGIARGTGAYSVGGPFSSKNFLAGLQADRRKLEDLFKDLGKKLGEEAVRWFNVPKSKRPKGFASGGWLTEPVWGIGMSGQQYTFAEYGPEPFGGSVRPGRMPRGQGGDVYNVYVAGDSDPDGAARRIIQKVSDYKRRHGNQSTGIG